MTRDLFVKYAELKTEAAELDRQLKDLQPRILEEMAVAEDKGVELEGVGVFTVIHRKVWKYTDTIKQLKENLDILKGQEEANGAATYEETRGVMFRGLL